MSSRAAGPSIDFAARLAEPRALAPKRRPEIAIMLFLVVSTPRPERPTELATTRQSFWPWMAGYEARGVCRHIYARAGRGAVAVLDVADNETLHKILNEWADIVPAHFDVYPLIDAQAANRALAAQVGNKT
jgi:muconolactone delta-isomerase